MIEYIRQWKTRGIHLKAINLMMGAVVALLAVMLMVSIYRCSDAYEAYRDATEKHATLRSSSYELQLASDYLTEQVRYYTETGERRHLDNYFEEADVTRRRDRALTALEAELGDTVPYQALQNAMNQSVNLMNREYYAMRLMMEALHENPEEYPEVLRQLSLSGEDQQLSDTDKEALARKMVFDEEYRYQKVIISDNMQACLTDLDGIMHERCQEASNLMTGVLNRQRVLIIALIICILCIVILNMHLMISPLLQAVNEIRSDKPITVHGAYEFRYLAHTYNLVYGTNLQNTERLAYEASHDKLTGLNNRSSFDFIMENMKLEECALILLDVDHFKEINDSQGHDVGDLALCAVAEVIRANFRTHDYIFRIGGDEFAVLLQRINARYTGMISRKINMINRQLENLDDRRMRSTISAGVTFSNGSKEPKEMFHQADKALYSVKNHGRRGCAFHADGVA